MVLENTVLPGKASFCQHHSTATLKVFHCAAGNEKFFMGVFPKGHHHHFCHNFSPENFSLYPPLVQSDLFEWANLISLFLSISAKGTLSEDTIRLFLRQLGKLFQKIENSCVCVISSLTRDY